MTPKGEPRRPAPAPPLPDEPARRAIRADLATTILVEAAAGTGKTHSLVERMVALVATGRTTIARLSAVTFTIRAAAQLRLRFQNALEEALREERHSERRVRLAEALGGLDACFLGTIHAFCARLLRERPVEAGVDPGFEEMDEPEDGVARGEAWQRFTSGLFLRDDPRLARLMKLSIPLQDLEGAFDAVCENADVEAPSGPDTPEPDFSEARRRVAELLEKAAGTLPARAPGGGWTKFQEAVRSARRLWELSDVESGPDFVRILKILRRRQALEGAAAFKKVLENLREDVIKPALSQWAEHAYPAVISILADAREDYRRARRLAGRLNFQDLLIEARNLLRDRPEVRRALRERFTPVLVDEFQDTDPIQAEILFLLTGDDAEERDWRRLTPLPGSLFVVGDPKQSIYRFRRADIETYEAVRTRVAKSGRVVTLHSNFRSTPDVCDWLNGTFSRLFPAAATREQAAHVPLEAVERKPRPGPSVFRLTTVVSGQATRPVIESDSRRIADFIAGALERRERAPGDFLVLFRRRAPMTDYARALEERRVPYEIAGGGAFDTRQLGDLLVLLRALSDPDDAVAIVAGLRGPFFGVDDEALYRFVRAGGRFDFRRETPASADARIARAFDLLREGAQLAETLPPAAAASAFAGRLGWTAFCATRDLGESVAGNLLKAFAAARKLSGEGLDFSTVVRELEQMRREEMIEQMSVEPGRPSAVRLMTLHGAKGLQAPVVFLAEPAYAERGVGDVWIDRSVDPPEGYFRVVKRMGHHSDEEIARPPDWDGMVHVEEAFDAAEKTRLLYVGASRAQDTLAVSILRRSAGKALGPWARLDPFLREELPDRAAQAARAGPPAVGLSDEVARFTASRAERAAICATPSYAVASVTSVAHAGADTEPVRASRRRGMEWGRIVHRLLEELMMDGGLDLHAFARNLFAEEGRAVEDLDEAVRLARSVQRSALWSRALAAKRRLVEVPFSLLVGSSELARSDGLLHLLGVVRAVPDACSRSTGSAISAPSATARNADRHHVDGHAGGAEQIP